MQEIEIMCVRKGMLHFYREDVINKYLEVNGYKLVSNPNNASTNKPSEWGVCKLTESEPKKYLPFAEFLTIAEMSMTVIYYGSRHQLRKAFENLRILRLKENTSSQVTVSL